MEILRRPCMQRTRMDTLTRVDFMLFSSCFLFSSLYLFFLFFFRESSEGRQNIKASLERERVATSCSSGTYRITMVLLVESIGRPVESHSRMCLRTWGLGFLSELKTNSSHLYHRWHNNHLCRRLFVSSFTVSPVERSLSAFLPRPIEKVVFAFVVRFWILPSPAFSKFIRYLQNFTVRN